MIITFICASASFPIGGITVSYELANALSRRGHRVQILHGPIFGTGIDDIDDISWFTFEEAIHHVNYGNAATMAALVGPPEALPPYGSPEHLHILERSWPPADVVFGAATRPESGLPVHLIQGVGMLDAASERAAMEAPGLKVCVASWLLDVCRNNGVPDEQLALVVNGIDQDRFRVLTPIDQRPPTVAILHSAHPAKGWPVGMDALVEAHRRVPELRAIAFGTAEPPGELPDWMDFVFDPRPDVLVQDIYNRSRVLIQPSFYEGFGFTAVEAMASGCALVTTDNGGSRDYAFPDETALVAPPDDVVLLADHLVRLLTDDDLRTRLSLAGNAYVRRFDWNRSAEILESHLERYLADPGAVLGRSPAPRPDSATHH